MNVYDWVAPMKCSICGKVIYCHDRDSWAYNRAIGKNRKYFCSWSCLRKYDENHKRKNLRVTEKNKQRRCANEDQK